MNRTDKHKLYWNNAKTLIQQVKDDEWEFKYNEYGECCITAHRHRRELWVGNGPIGLQIDKKNTFGSFLSYYVWYSGVNKKRKECNKKYKGSGIPRL